ncbi:MAG: AbrB/MazE/SpoVT family DNA-binding domain-containing protein [Nanoarchaeota archaeon]
MTQIGKKSRVIELGTISARGQVAIPSRIRAELELSEGEKVLFISEGDTLIIKKVMGKKTWDEITRSLREAAKKSDLKEEDAENIIHRFRKEKRKK